MNFFYFFVFVFLQRKNRKSHQKRFSKSPSPIPIINEKSEDIRSSNIEEKSSSPDFILVDMTEKNSQKTFPEMDLTQ